MPMDAEILKSAKHICILFIYIIFIWLRKDEQSENIY